MKQKLILASTAAVALMASGSSFAASKSATMNFSFVVASTCDIYLSTTDTINQTDVHDMTGEGWDNNLGVTCSEDLPYIVEASTDANGQVLASSATSSRQYPVTLYRGIDTRSAPKFGTDANGLALSGVGTGAHQPIPLSYDFGQRDDHFGYYKQLAEGTYTASVTFTVTY
ncbi:hypothetical protein [Stenotrophomonas sp. SG1]|uniref:hypothetical protein n=1 Tax=Stenotrophomonas sp. SG1 TaxID=2944932 RepID=UPI002243E43E|nr:hypothetical protein [Stenotrophomonas sp. SG1]MCW8340601.1 hypothetical protein [Stenotrophomonas sp. SG1]